MTSNETAQADPDATVARGHTRRSNKTVHHQ